MGERSSSRSHVLVRASLTNARASAVATAILSWCTPASSRSPASARFLQRGTLLSRVSSLWTLRQAWARVYHSQPMINCAWRNILTASFLSAFKYCAKRARRNPRKRKRETEKRTEGMRRRWWEKEEEVVYRGTPGKKGIVLKGGEPLTFNSHAA